MIILGDLDESEIDKIMDSQPVIMVGSLISSFFPTAIPAGGEILKQMYDYIFSEYNGIEYNYFKREFYNMPFEALYSMAPENVVKPEMLAKIFENKQSNKMHELLAESLEKGKISAIITPNYDKAIDNCIKDKNRILYSGDCCEKANKGSVAGVLFKIHGSIVDPRTMIFTLEQEKNLHPAKIETLKKILYKRVLIVMGYSGRDFDICPLITSREIYKYERIVWLQHRKANGECEELSAYAQHVLKEHEKINLIIGGDIENFFRRFWKQTPKQLTVQFDSGSFNPIDFFDLTEREHREWQLRIINRLSCGILGKLHLEKIKDKVGEKFYLDMLWDLHGHAMEIKQSIKTVKKLLKLYKESDKDYYRLLSTLSGFYLSNGQFLQAWNYLHKARKNAVKHHKGLKWFELEIMHRDLTRQTSLYKFGLPGAQNKGRMILEKLLRFDYYNDQNWDQKQGIFIANDRLNLDIQIPNDIPQMLQSRLAYRNLGEPNHEILSFRDEASRFFTLNGSLKTINEKNDKEVLNELHSLVKSFNLYLQKAQYLGKNAEVWKLCKLRIDWFDDSRRIQLAYWRLWKRYLDKTESGNFFTLLQRWWLFRAYLILQVKRIAN